MNKEKAMKLMEQMEVLLCLAPNKDECTAGENEIFAGIENLCNALKNNVDVLPSALS